jgi:ubiquinone/menaquinone biosynthesis C-methylase UbiE
MALYDGHDIYMGGKDWFSDREIAEDTLIAYDPQTGAPMPSLKLAYEYIKDCNKILDIGCGTGRIVQWLKDKGHDAYGVTYNDDELEFAIDTLKYDTIVYGDMQDLKFAEDTFDAVMGLESFEHAESIVRAVMEAKRITKPGGKIVIYIPGQKWIECLFHWICPTIRQFKWIIQRIGGLTIEGIHEWVNDESFKGDDQEATYLIRKT